MTDDTANPPTKMDDRYCGNGFATADAPHLVRCNNNKEDKFNNLSLSFDCSHYESIISFPAFLLPSLKEKDQSRNRKINFDEKSFFLSHR
jgi:hypothetical protein